MQKINKKKSLKWTGKGRVCAWFFFFFWAYQKEIYLMHVFSYLQVLIHIIPCKLQQDK